MRVEPLTKIQQVIDDVTVGMNTEDYIGLMQELRDITNERIAMAEGELDGSLHTDYQASNPK